MKKKKQTNYDLCPICGRTISKSNMKRHIKAHEHNGKWYKIEHLHSYNKKDLFCKFCGRECKNKNSLA